MTGTATREHSGVPDVSRPGPWLPRLMRSEHLKLSTTNVWWFLLLGTVPWTGIALTFNIIAAQFSLNPPENVQNTGQELGGPIVQASNIYTSGQFLGLMLVMVLGIVMVTNEYFHQTATVTYLTTPRRTRVLIAKLFTAMVASVLFWGVTTVLALGVGMIYFGTQEYGLLLDEWEVQRSILLNLLAFVLWATLGLAIGALLKNQLVATIVATVVYLLGFAGVAFGFQALASALDSDFVQELQVAMPAIASQVMVSGGGEDIPGTPDWWVGALILLAYTVIPGTIGVLLNRRRDIS